MLHNMEKNGNSESDVVEEIEIFKSVVKMKNIGEIAFQLGSSLLESSLNFVKKDAHTYT